mmetsp:Transcript_6974/g.17134  ORF Transcript_6974/g.17134 Transcript_6974/m.17134 type:complete len:287 (+) Transcript_6974:86-946(+)
MPGRGGPRLPRAHQGPCHPAGAPRLAPHAPVRPLARDPNQRRGACVRYGAGREAALGDAGRRWWWWCGVRSRAGALQPDAQRAAGRPVRLAPEPRRCRCGGQVAAHAAHPDEDRAPALRRAGGARAGGPSRRQRGAAGPFSPVVDAQGGFPESHGPWHQLTGGSEALLLRPFPSNRNFGGRDGGTWAGGSAAAGDSAEALARDSGAIVGEAGAAAAEGGGLAIFFGRACAWRRGLNLLEGATRGRDPIADGIIAAADESENLRRRLPPILPPLTIQNARVTLFCIA